MNSTDFQAKLLLGLINLLMTIRVYEVQGPFGTNVYVDAINEAIDEHKMNYEALSCWFKSKEAPLYEDYFSKAYSDLVLQALKMTDMSEKVFKEYNFA